MYKAGRKNREAHVSAYIFSASPYLSRASIRTWDIVCLFYRAVADSDRISQSTALDHSPSQSTESRAISMPDLC